ncbi:hypothetical protein Mgra_00001515 [Meloidogyne graminicola]|uniref:DEP domain-containing protein n=1 Tax=Meloidogyne graminicola TaxID=189291 RepID=A0A8T0A107_9BILA|nr:hypothetical protein Mgra_00001515 [Meloidogyne graminicola]
MSERQQNSTKVYYHLDDSTPYMSEVKISPDYLTLGDFKRVFNRKGYRYFCKEWDPNLQREVKAEITNDHQLLRKSANGLIELFLLSQQNSTTALPLPNKTSLMETINETNSDLQTLVSKRAGENLAEMYNSTSEDPYNRTSVSSSIFRRKPFPGVPMPSAESTSESAAERTLLVNTSTARQKRLRKQRYVPSTISSESESTYSLPRIEEVKLRLQDAPLGIAVASQCGSIFIYHIQHGSAAEKCGRLEVGDQIVQIDDTRFEELNEKQALEVLKRLNYVKKTITMYVAKRARTNGGESSEEHKSDPLSLLCETQQLDISQWVESTTNKNCIEQVLPFDEIPPINSPQDLKGKNQIIDDTSDEEKAAYLDRRNGLGVRLVPIIHKVRSHQKQKSLDQKPELKMIELENNPTTSSCPIMLGAVESALDCHPPLVQQPLHAAMDAKLILRRMVEADSGLEIRDRKWLKIPVPMSFIGEEMIDWLLINVQGFRDRRNARTFASNLLAHGLIKHVVNMNTFNEKCYYVFNDEIIAGRLTIENNKQQNTADVDLNNKVIPSALVPESNTEITYMSNNQLPPVTSSCLMSNLDPSQNIIIDSSVNRTINKHQMVIANNPRYAPGPLPNHFSGKIPKDTALITDAAHLNKIIKDSKKSTNTAIPLRTLNPPKFGLKLPVWPISPILSYYRPQNQTIKQQKQQRCDSPDFLKTNDDYASMIQGEINCGAQFDDGILTKKQQLTEKNISLLG